MTGSRWLTASSLALLVGCGATVEKPAQVIEVPVRERIVCPKEPPVDHVTMRTVDEPRVMEYEGEQWVALPLRQYVALALNLAELKTNYAQRLSQLHYLRGCIARFNANVTPKEVTP